MRNNKYIDNASFAVEQWQKEIPSLKSSNMLLIGRMAECLSLIFKQLTNLYAEYNINGGEFDVLATLRRSGEPYRLSPTDLYYSLMITSGTMTNRLQHLEKKNLIIRLPNNEDRRSMLVGLNNNGLKLINKLVFKHVEVEKSLNELLPKNIRNNLENGLLQWLKQIKDNSESSSRG